MEVKSISLSRLLKMELPGFIETIIDILKKYDVEKLHLDFWLKVLKKNQKQIKTLTIPLGAHPLSERIVEWHNQRLMYASSISIQMRGIAKGNLPNLKGDIATAQVVVKDYLADFRGYNKSEITSQINNFLNTVEDETTVKNAFINLGLMPYIEQLKLAHQTHEHYYGERRKSKSKIQKRDINKAIKQEGEQALRSFFEQVEVANRTYPELNYAPLIRELNNVIAEHTNLINTRATYNRKRAQKVKAEKEAIAAAQANTEVQLMTVNDKPTGVMIVKN